MIVELSWWEFIQGATAGIYRRVLALQNKRGDRYGAPALTYWETDIESACAEMALAKALGLYWQSVVTHPEVLEGDVGSWQVRWTKRPDGRLILHEADRNDQRYTLIVGQSPVFDIVGWILGKDGKQPQYWFEGDGRPAFFVPRSALHPIMRQLEL